MFIRFVVSHTDIGSGHRQGLFQAAKALRESGALSTPEDNELKRIREWFNERLERPTRLAISSRPHGKERAISWFKDSAKEHIAKMREMQRVLERHGVVVHVVKASRLGYVLYEDEFQVAAYPFADTPT